MTFNKLKLFTCYILVFVSLHCSIGQQSKQAKLVIQDGSLIFQSGENGDIVLEPSPNGDVFIGKSKLNVSATGQKGEQGDQGTKGDTGEKGDTGNPGLNGTDGARGENGPKGDVGLHGAGRSCDNSSDYGNLKAIDGIVQMCSQFGWIPVSADRCQEKPPNVAMENLRAFTEADFGVLLQFNDGTGNNLTVNYSPKMADIDKNITLDSSLFTGSYEDSPMGQAVNFTGFTNIKLSGLPGTNFWNDREWSVMAFIKFWEPDPSNKFQEEIAVLGDGVTDGLKGFHLGVSKKKFIFGYYSADMKTDAVAEYDKWTQVTFTWKPNPRTRTIIVDGVKLKSDSPSSVYSGGSTKTEIGSWWSQTARNNSILIDTLFIIDKAIDYNRVINKQECFAKNVQNIMPLT